MTSLSGLGTTGSITSTRRPMLTPTMPAEASSSPTSGGYLFASIEMSSRRGESLTSLTCWLILWSGSRESKWMDTTELSLRGQDHETESTTGTSPSSSPYSIYPRDLVLLLKFLSIYSFPFDFCSHIWFEFEFELEMDSLQAVSFSLDQFAWPISWNQFL